MIVGNQQLLRALGDWRIPGTALPQALAGAIRRAVLDGLIRPGSRLPAERAMAATLGISRGTVTTTLAQLRESGWLRSRQGSASVVQLPPSAAGRIAPMSATGHAGTIDLRRAVTSAPRAAYVGASMDALGQAETILAEDGEPGPGLPVLRSFLAERYTAQGLPTRPEQILVTSGTRACLALLAAHLRPRTSVVEVPTYFDALDILRGVGSRLAGCHVMTTGWTTQQLEAAFASAHGGLAYLIPDFQNPTGALMDPDTRRLVADLAVQHSVAVVVDETMRDLDLRNDPVPPARIRGAIHIGSAGKAVWSGLRVGWIRASTHLISALTVHPLCAPLSGTPATTRRPASPLRPG